MKVLILLSGTYMHVALSIWYNYREFIRLQSSIYKTGHAIFNQCMMCVIPLHVHAHMEQMYYTIVGYTNKYVVGECPR